MGGSAGGGNAQLFELMSRYGGSGGGGDGMTPEQRRQYGQADWQNQIHNYAANHSNGGSGIFGIFPDINFHGGGWRNKDKPPGTGTGTGTPPATQQPFSWAFPQYSQTWAFTPPTPTPYMNPPPFDAATYDTKKKTTTKTPTKTPTGSKTPGSA